jgi:hypothetical protein
MICSVVREYCTHLKSIQDFVLLYPFSKDFETVDSRILRHLNIYGTLWVIEHNYGNPPCLTGKSSVNWANVHSYVSLPEANPRMLMEKHHLPCFGIPVVAEHLRTWSDFRNCPVAAGLQVSEEPTVELVGDQIQHALNM